MVSGVNFTTGILLARYLVLEEFGRFTPAWLAMLFVNAIQHPGIISPLMSIGPKQTAQDEPAYYGAIAAQQLIFGAVVFTLVLGGVAAAAAMFSDCGGIGGLALPLTCAAFAIQAQDFLRRHFFALGCFGRKAAAV